MEELQKKVASWFFVVVAVALCLPAVNSMFSPGGTPYPWEAFVQPYREGYRSGRMGDMYTNQAVESEIVSRCTETPTAYVYTVEVSGTLKKDVKVEAEEGVLRIKGEEKTYEKQRGDVHWSYGQFWKRFVLADDADVNNIHTQIADRVLTVTVPRLHHKKKAT